MAGALYAYNPSRHYVRAVSAYAGQLRANPRAFLGYYHWQRERPQPLPPISRAAQRRQRCRAALLCASAALSTERQLPTQSGEALMGSVNWRKRGNRYQVAWRTDDGTQGAKTVATKDEALDLVAEKRVEMSRRLGKGAAAAGSCSASGLTNGGQYG
jgi:hypothetical protein